MNRAMRCLLVPALALLASLAPLPVLAAFVDNGDGTVTDTVTGLMWDKCPYGQTANDCSGGSALRFTWANALVQTVALNGINYKSHNDWRLPSIRELESLVKISLTNPAIDDVAFPNTDLTQWYWSSTLMVHDGSVWAVFFQTGDFNTLDMTLQADKSFARVVRGGQPGDNFDILAPDTTPDPFSFTPQVGVALSTVATSNTITVSGINAAAPISIVGGSYSINGGAYTAAAGSVNNGNTVTLQQTSSASYSALTTATLTIGGVTGAFNVTTLASPVATPPVLAAAFGATSIALNGKTSLTFTITNPNAAIALTGVAFTDTLPPGLAVATPTNLTGSCGGGAIAAAQGAVLVTLAGAAIPAAGSCQFSVDVTATALGLDTNVTGNVTSANGGTGNAATAVLGVAQLMFSGPTATGTGTATATMSTANGGPACGFTGGGFVPVASVPSAPPGGVSFPQGLVALQIGNCAMTGISVTVTLTFPQSLPPGTVYWKYGPAAKGAVPSWYMLPGANVAGNQITFTLTDGQQGDDDWSVNGALADPGGAGVSAAPPPPAQAAPIPVLSSFTSLMVTAALVFLLAAMFAPHAFRARRQVTHGCMSPGAIDRATHTDPGGPLDAWVR